MVGIEYYYKVLDRQLKKQFMHGLNDIDILPEIIREPTKMMKICW